LILTVGKRQIQLTVWMCGHFRQKGRGIEASQDEILKLCEAAAAI
jgi:hypothetical protein